MKSVEKAPKTAALEALELIGRVWRWEQVGARYLTEDIP